MASNYQQMTMARNPTMMPAMQSLYPTPPESQCSSGSSGTASRQGSPPNPFHMHHNHWLKLDQGAAHDTLPGIHQARGSFHQTSQGNGSSLQLWPRDTLPPGISQARGSFQTAEGNGSSLQLWPRNTLPPSVENPGIPQARGSFHQTAQGNGSSLQLWPRNTLPPSVENPGIPQARGSFQTAQGNGLSLQLWPRNTLPPSVENPGIPQARGSFQTAQGIGSSLQFAYAPAPAQSRRILGRHGAPFQAPAALHIPQGVAAAAAIAASPVRRQDYPRAIVYHPDGRPHQLPRGARPRDMPTSYWKRVLRLLPGVTLDMLPSDYYKRDADVNTVMYWVKKSMEAPATVASRFNALHKVLGKGGFGSVYLAEKKGANSSEPLVAVKIIEKKNFYIEKNDNKKVFDASKSEEVAKEVDLLRFFSDPSHQPWFRAWFPTFIEAFQTNGHVALVMEYCVGDLFDLGDIVGAMPWVNATFYLAQIAKALSLIHQQELLFRDLKTENVFIDARGHCKIGDFGLALDLRKGKRNKPLSCYVDKEGELGMGTAFVGNEFLMSPERRRHLPYGKPADWYSLGIIAYELATSDRDSILPFDSVCNPDRDPASYDTAPLLPTAADIKNHSLSWDAVSVIRGLTDESPVSRWCYWDLAEAPTLKSLFQGDMRQLQAPYDILRLRAMKEMMSVVPGKGMSKRELEEHLEEEPSRDMAFFDGIEEA